MWKDSQKLKILKGAADQRRDLYATFEYILYEGRKYKRDLRTKFTEDNAKDDRNHKGVHYKQK